MLVLGILKKGGGYIMKADSPDDLRLNPKQFANLVVGSHQVPDDKNPEKIVKRKLTLYLTAYYLAERFNELQEETLSHSPSRENFNQLLKKLEDERFQDW